MRRAQAICVLRRVVERGEHFAPAVLRQALLLAHDPSHVRDDAPPRGLSAAPPGCVWDRPAAGWVDLVREGVAA